MQSCLNMKKNEDILFRSSRTSGDITNEFFELSYSKEIVITVLAYELARNVF